MDEAFKEQKKRIDRVVNFLWKHDAEEHSLEKLASLAHYSPFHFQRVFTQLVGASPKQFATRVRLENACHSVFVHRHKSIATIAAEHGYSSPAVFARSFKAYFGVSPEGFRKSDVARKSVHERIEKEHHQPNATSDYSQYDKVYWSKYLSVELMQLRRQQLVAVSAPLEDAHQIREAFSRVTLLAGIHNLLADGAHYVGIFNPHQGKYWASIVASPTQKICDDLTTFTLEGGKYATYALKGDSVTTFHSLHAFFDLWLLNSGYRIRDLFGIERLCQNPVFTPYEHIERQLYVSLEPA